MVVTVCVLGVGRGVKVGGVPVERATIGLSVSFMLVYFFFTERVL